jgi:hypothetical protein
MIKFKTFYESLRNKPENPLMHRAISNMKSDSQVAKEFGPHTNRLRRETESDNYDDVHSKSAIIATRYNDPGNVTKAEVDKAASHKIRKPMTLFRGLHKDDPLHHQLEKASHGDTVEVHGGTSHGRAIPKEYAKHGGSVLVVHAGKGTRGAHVSGLMHDPDDEDEDHTSEREVLLGTHKAH